ncbi:outer membrane lipoprotein-sorting protein [candidate division WOR-3 bacterium]|nr:outer membrane lipoprotein-sorting protein [candidate division WOR-3 bacterium]
MKKLFVVGLIIVFACLAVYAETGDEVLKKMKDKYENFETDVKDMEMVNKMTINDKDGDLDIEMTVYKKDKKFRFNMLVDIDTEEIQMGNISSVVIYDGKDMWINMPFIGKQRIEDQADADEYNSIMDMFWWNKFGENATIEGSEKIDGNDCYILKFTELGDDYNGFEKVWVDKSEYTIKKAVSYGEEGYILFKDYKDVYKGYKLPYKTEFYSEEVKDLEIEMVSIIINKGINDDMFDIDKVEVDNSGMEDMLKNMINE